MVLFLIDDLGWQDASLPFHTERTPFNERYRTPHLERLAAEGVLRHGYARPRSARHPDRHPHRPVAGAPHITYWTLYADRDQTTAQRGEGSAWWRPPGGRRGWPRRTDAGTAALQAGFWTIHVGKAHPGGSGPRGGSSRLGIPVNVADTRPEARAPLGCTSSVRRAAVASPESACGTSLAWRTTTTTTST